jgi:hypothetical protein
MGANKLRLQSALIELHKQLAVERLGRGSFLSPQSLLLKTLLDRIVALAHDHKISTLNSLRKQISWGFINSHGPQIVELVNKHCPPVLTSPFTMAPLQPHSTATASSSVANSLAGSHLRAKGKCGACGATDGHNSEPFIVYNLYSSVTDYLQERTCQDSRGIALQAAKENQAP